MKNWYVFLSFATIGFAVVGIIGLFIISFLIQLLFRVTVVRLGKRERRINFKSALLFSSLLYFIAIPYILGHDVYSGMVDQMTTFIRNNTQQISFLQSQYDSVTIPAEYTSLVDRMKATQENLANEWQADLLLAVILGGVLVLFWGLGQIASGSKLKRGFQLVALVLVAVLLLIPCTFGYHMFVYAHGQLSEPQSFTVVGQTQSDSGTGSGSSSFPWEGLHFSRPYASLSWTGTYWASPLVLMLLGWLAWRAYERIGKSSPSPLM